MDNLTKEDCGFYKPWKPANTDCCEPGQSPHTGYSASDQPVSYCMQGQLMVAKSLTSEKNGTEPYQGTLTTPPQWVVRTLDQHILALIS